MSTRSRTPDQSPLDPFDVPLVDHELLAEVELATELMIAASRTEHLLTQAEVDRVLGVNIPQQPKPGLL